MPEIGSILRLNRKLKTYFCMGANTEVKSGEVKTTDGNEQQLLLCKKWSPKTGKS